MVNRNNAHAGGPCRVGKSLDLKVGLGLSCLFGVRNYLSRARDEGVHPVTFE